MVELKDIAPFTKELSLLYIDEDQNFLFSITKELNSIFKHVDDANDATLAISYAKLNEYNLIIMDANSTIMSSAQLAKNIGIKDNDKHLVITYTSFDEALLDIPASLYIKKPLSLALLLEKLLPICIKIQKEYSYKKDIAKLNADLLYERKRIGRFMLNEKKIMEKIKEYENSIQVDKNIYELTKLPSKYALQKALNGTQQSLIYINIDHFDFVNSIYGMGKANKLLKECAKRLNLFLPKNAELFHITADEFVILIDEPVLNQDIELTEQVRALFKEAELEFDNYSHSIVFSIGIDRGEGKKLFVNAKSASKEAKYFGGDQTVVFSTNSSYMKEQRENLQWISILKQAFENDKIFIYFQPIINNSNPQIKHFEILCRLMDDKNQLLDASKFINSAKLVGYITQITRTVIDKAFKVFSKNDYNFSINISMYDLHEEYLATFLKYKCEKYSIAPSRVHLEIVEDIIISKFTSVDEQVHKLTEMGFHVIIDDFSTDKSAYNRMFDLKAEFIKIDGSFIKEMHKKKSHLIIVQSIVSFAKKSGIKTIAEHIESREVYEIVKKLGIDYSQGYYLGKPSRSLEY